MPDEFLAPIGNVVELALSITLVYVSLAPCSVAEQNLLETKERVFLTILEHRITRSCRTSRSSRLSVRTQLWVRIGSTIGHIVWIEKAALGPVKRPTHVAGHFLHAFLSLAKQWECWEHVL